MKSFTRRKRPALPFGAVVTFCVLCAVAGAGLGLVSRAEWWSNSLLIALSAVVVVVGSQACKLLGQVVIPARAVGLDVIVCLVLPSLLVTQKAFPAVAVTAFADVLDHLDLLNWLVITFVLGGLAALDRASLGPLAAKLILPVVVASLAALLIGTAAVLLLFPDFSAGMMFKVVPAMVGGIAAGALPLSLGYASVTGTDPGAALSQMLPTVFAANLCGIVIAALIGFVRPSTSGLAAEVEPKSGRTPPAHVAIALCAVCLLYTAGWLTERWLSLPTSLTVTIAVIALVFAGVLPRAARNGAVAVTAFTTRYLLFPILWVIGMVVITWGQVVAGLSPSTLLTAAALMATLAGAGGLAARSLQMDGMDGAIVALSRGAMGGTGAMVMLKAANRLDLLAYAVLTVRICGTVTLAIALKLIALEPG